MVAAKTVSDSIIAAFKAELFLNWRQFANICVRMAFDCLHNASPAVLSGEGHLASSCNGNNITVARFDVSQFDSKWFRITARNSSGQMAWSNPYFKSDLGL